MDEDRNEGERNRCGFLHVETFRVCIVECLTAEVI